MANFPGPGSIILRGRGKSRIDPGSEDGRILQYHLRITNPVLGQKRKQLWNVIIPQVCTEVINEMIILAIGHHL